jgi:hypothetical protein
LFGHQVKKFIKSLHFIIVHLCHTVYKLIALWYDSDTLRKKW